MALYITLDKHPLVFLYQVIVVPGPSTASTSEAEGDASPAMDSLVEGAAGMTGYFNIQVAVEPANICNY